MRAVPVVLALAAALAAACGGAPASRIVVAREAGGSGAVVSVAPDGTGATIVVPPATGVDGVAASADGRRLAVVGSAGVVLEGTAQGGAQARIDAAVVGMPAWSPDGTSIAFADAEGLWVADADGAHPRRIRDAGTQPAWSPEGQRIAFVEARDGGSEVWVVDAAGGGARALLRDADLRSAGAHVLGSPAWSPDGEMLAFTAGRDDEPGRSSISTLDLRTGDVHRVTDGGGASAAADAGAGGRVSAAPPVVGDSAPAWSPDAGRIAFIRSRGARAELWSVHRDGSGARVVLADAAAVLWTPTWVRG